MLAGDTNPKLGNWRLRKKRSIQCRVVRMNTHDNLRSLSPAHAFSLLSLSACSSPVRSTLFLCVANASRLCFFSYF